MLRYLLLSSLLVVSGAHAQDIRLVESKPTTDNRYNALTVLLPDIMITANSTKKTENSDQLCHLDPQVNSCVTRRTTTGSMVEENESAAIKMPQISVPAQHLPKIR